MTRERDRLLTTTAVARILGLSADMVRRLARSGKLSPQFTTTTGVRCFRLKDVQELQKARAVRSESSRA
jgi:DNA-binding transcriptional MerR regulator